MYNQAAIFNAFQEFVMKCYFPFIRPLYFDLSLGFPSFPKMPYKIP